MKDTFFLFLIGVLSSYGLLFKWFTSPTHPRDLPPLHIGFLPGSGIKKEYYDHFLQHLRSTTSRELDIRYMNYFPFDHTPNNTILIGHSFGGFMCLIYSIRDIIRNEHHIRLCVLLNSHFNEGNVMMYPGINMSLVLIPTLVILGAKDNRLPLDKARDDYARAIDRNVTHVNFHITNGTHFSIFSQPNETYVCVTRILDFFRENNIKI